MRREEGACPCAVTAVLIKDYYTQYFRLYLLLIYHYTLSVPGYGNTMIRHHHKRHTNHSKGLSSFDLEVLALQVILAWQLISFIQGLGP